MKQHPARQQLSQQHETLLKNIKARVNKPISGRYNKEGALCIKVNVKDYEALREFLTGKNSPYMERVTSPLSVKAVYSNGGQTVESHIITLSPQMLANLLNDPALNTPQNPAHAQAPVQPTSQATGLMREDDFTLGIKFEQAMSSASFGDFSRTQPLAVTKKADGSLTVTAYNAEDARAVAKFLKGQYGIKDKKADPSPHAITLSKAESDLLVHDFRVEHELKRLNNALQQGKPPMNYDALFEKERNGLKIVVSGAADKDAVLKFLETEGYLVSQLEIKSTTWARHVSDPVTGKHIRLDYTGDIIIPANVLKNRYAGAAVALPAQAPQAVPTPVQNLSEKELKAIKHTLKDQLDKDGVELEYSFNVKCNNGVVTVGVTDSDVKGLIAALEKHVGKVDSTQITLSKTQYHQISHITLNAKQVATLLGRQQAAPVPTPAKAQKSEEEIISKSLTKTLAASPFKVKYGISVEKENGIYYVVAKDGDIDTIETFLKLNGEPFKKGEIKNNYQNGSDIAKIPLRQYQVDAFLGKKQPAPVVPSSQAVATVPVPTPAQPTQPQAGPTAESALEGFFVAAGVNLTKGIDIKKDHQNRMFITVDNNDIAVVEQFLKQSGFVPSQWSVKQSRSNGNVSHITLPEALQQQLLDAVNTPVAVAALPVPATPAQAGSSNSATALANQPPQGNGNYGVIPPVQQPWATRVPQPVISAPTNFKKEPDMLLLKQPSSSHPYVCTQGRTTVQLDGHQAKNIAQNALRGKNCFGMTSGNTLLICMDLPSDPHQRESLHNLLELCGVKDYKSDKNRGILSVSSANEKSFGALEKALGKTFDKLPCERDFRAKQQHQVG